MASTESAGGRFAEPRPPFAPGVRHPCVASTVRALNGRFIRVHNRSEYAPQEKNPKGELHEDDGWFSFDRARKRIVFRQFHVEGFVNQILEQLADASGGVVFTTEAIKNIPSGWRARETYIVHGPDEFEEVFELSETGKPFELYWRARLKRVK